MTNGQSYDYIVSAVNSVGQGAPSNSATATPGPALSITTTALNPATATVGVGYSALQAVAATGGQTPYSWSASGLPNGMGINATSGAVFGTPTVAGTFNFTVTVRDSSSPQKTASKALSLTVSAATLAPAITSAGTATGIVGQAFNYQIAASNSPTSYGASPLPAGLSVNSITGLISGTPSASGTFNATVTATNSAGTGSKVLTFTVNAPAVAAT